MPLTPIFPLEIEETILDLLAEDDKDHSALKTCSLVCQAFLPICRKHIFGSIVLNDYQTPPSTTHALALLLSRTPEIADYVRKFEYTIHVAGLTSPSIQESLKRISRLKSLTVRHINYGLIFDWSNNPLRPALLHLLHLPTLTHFKLTGINNFVVSDLTPCTNLTYLNIGHDTTCAIEIKFPAALPDHAIQLNEFVASNGYWNQRCYYETLYSSTSRWTTSYRFQVSFHDNSYFR